MGYYLQDTDGLFPIAVVVAAFLLAKVLAKLGVATKHNASRETAALSVLVGVAYAVNFEFVRSFGPIVDAFLRVAFGAMVGGVLWVFILVGVGGATNGDDKAAKA